MNIKCESLSLVETIYEEKLNLKGNKLLTFLKEECEYIKGHILSFNKRRKYLELTKELKTLLLMINEIYTYSSENKNTTFFNCIKECKNTNTDDWDIDYELDNYFEEEYDDNDDDDDDDDDEIVVYKKKRKNDKNHEFIQQVFTTQSDNPEKIISDYYSTLTSKKRKKALVDIKEINDYHKSTEPILFRILDMPLSLNQKNNILKTYIGLASSRFPEKKLKTWFDALMTIPFGKYKGVNLKDMKSKKIKSFLDDLQKIMDDTVHGHSEAKRQIIQMMAQQIKNPECKGSMLGLWGVPGNGKTSLIKDGIAKALDKPFIFISLGGATDSSFLEGHSFTYEGSICGRIVDGLINSKCMDPIIYFDELDKISKTPKGDEITNILIHLTDPVQNSHFRDKYFYGIDIDLSKATMIFSFNDPSNVNHVLLDRITTIETKYLILSQKIYIAHNHLLPNIIKDMGMNTTDININDDTIKFIIDNWTHEGGVRKLKSILYNIIREVNIANLTKELINNVSVVYPYEINIDNVKTILKEKKVLTPEKIHENDTSGVINGLYASSNGSYGGIIPIQILWFPSTSPLEVKATGNLQHVIKESTQVATSLAFNKLDLELQEKYLLSWKDRPKGIHIHCPDGAIPKDGPSAGTALTVAIYSILTDRKIRRDIAITGEINLQGYVSAIGGLDNKLEGAKKAGVKLVLYPKENEKDIIQIKERDPTLIDDSFKVIAIDSIDEALQYSLL